MLALLAHCLPIFTLLATLTLPICSTHVWKGASSNALHQLRGGNVESSTKESDKYIIPVRLPGGSIKTIAVSSSHKVSALCDQLTKIAIKNPLLKDHQVTLVSIEQGKPEESKNHHGYTDIPLSNWADNDASLSSLGITKSSKIVLHIEQYKPLSSIETKKSTSTPSTDKTRQAVEGKRKKEVIANNNNDDDLRIRIERQKASKQKVVLPNPLEGMLMQVHQGGRMLALIGRQRLQHTTASRAAERKKKQRAKQRQSTWTLGEAASELEENQPKQLLEIFGAVDLQLTMQSSQEVDLNIITDKLKKLQDELCNELGLQVVGLASRSATPWNPTVFHYTAAAALALGRNASSFIHLSVLNEANADDDDSTSKKKKSKKRVLAFTGNSKFKVEPFHLSNQALELCLSGQLPLLTNPSSISSTQSSTDDDEDKDKKDNLVLAEGRSVLVGGRVVEQINCYLLAVTLPIIAHKTNRPTDFLSIFPSSAVVTRDSTARRFLVKLARNLLKIGEGKDRVDTLSRMRDLQLLEHLKSMLSNAAFQSLATLLRYDNGDNVVEEKEVEAMQQLQLNWQPSPQLAMELDALRLSLEAEDEVDNGDEEL